MSEFYEYKTRNRIFQFLQENLVPDSAIHAILNQLMVANDAYNDIISKDYPSTIAHLHLGFALDKLSEINKDAVTFCHKPIKLSAHNKIWQEQIWHLIVSSGLINAIHTTY